MPVRGTKYEKSFLYLSRFGAFLKVVLPISTTGMQAAAGFTKRSGYGCGTNCNGGPGTEYVVRCKTDSPKIDARLPQKADMFDASAMTSRAARDTFQFDKRSDCGDSANRFHVGTFEGLLFAFCLAVCSTG